MAMDTPFDGNSAVVRCLSRWLEEAKTGKFDTVALVLVDEGNLVTELVGSSREFAVNFALDHLKARTMQSFVERETMRAAHRPSIVIPGRQ